MRAQLLIEWRADRAESYVPPAIGADERAHCLACAVPDGCAPSHPLCSLRAQRQRPVDIDGSARRILGAVPLTRYATVGEIVLAINSDLPTLPLMMIERTIRALHKDGVITRSSNLRYSRAHGAAGDGSE